MRRSHQLIVGAASNALGNLATALVGVILPSFVIDQIGADRYGLVVVLTSTLRFVALVQLGTPQALQRFVSQELARRDFEKASQLLSTGLMLLLVAALFGSCVVALVAAVPDRLLVYPASLDTSIVRGVVLVMGGAALLSFPLSLGNIAFYVTARFPLLNGIRVFQTLTRLGLVFFLLWLFQGSVLAYASANAAATILGATAMFWVGRRLLPDVSLRIRHVKRKTMQSIVGYGFLTFLNIFVFRFFVDADYVIVGWTLGPREVTVLNLALVWGLVLRQLASSALSVLTPSTAVDAARDDRRALQAVLIRSTKYSFIVGLVPTVFLCGFRSEVMEVWMGSGFADSARLMIPLLLAELLTTATSGANGMLYGLGTIRPILLVNLVSGAANVIIVLVLTGVKDMGVDSVAWTYLSIFVIRSGILLPAWFANYVGLSVWGLYRQSYLAPLLTGILMVPLVVALQWWHHPATWPELIAMAAGFSICCLPLLVFVALDSYDRQVFLSMFKRLLPSASRGE